MSKKRLPLIIAVILVLAVVFLSILRLRQYKDHTEDGMQTQTQTTDQSATVKARPTVDELFKLTNDDRALAGVAAVGLNEQLNKSAQLKADEMERTGDFAHTSTDGKEGWTYIVDVGGIECIETGENINNHADERTSQEIMDSWFAGPPGIRNAIRDPKWELMGFAVSEHYVVQHFCDTH